DLAKEGSKDSLLKLQKRLVAYKLYSSEDETENFLNSLKEKKYHKNGKLDVKLLQSILIRKAMNRR
ncbi:MAG: hypothetical protein ABIF92_00895, partial [archaeon]